MGKIFTRVCYMYKYTLDYVLWKMTIDQVLMLYDYGMEFIKVKSIILINTLAQFLTGKKPKTKEDIDFSDQKPDRKAFYKHFGDRIIKIDNKKTEKRD